MKGVEDLDVFKLAHEPALKVKDLQYISEDLYRDRRTGYDRVVQMLSRLIAAS